MTDNESPLSALYPFLHGGGKDPAREQQALLDSVTEKAKAGVAAQRAFYANNTEALIEAAHAMAGVYREGGRMFAMGNGGSSCDASHFAVEFQHPVTTGRPALPAVNLVTDFAVISAVANDIGVEHVFVRQLQAHGHRGDGLIGFSTSGNSENLVAAYRKARSLGLVTFGLAGGNGGEMRASGLVDHCLVVETDSIHRVQEVHVSVYHILWDLTHTLLADSRGDQRRPKPSHTERKGPGTASERSPLTPPRDPQP